MTRSIEQLRSDALRIWKAGVDGVRSDRLVSQSLQRDGDWLLIDDEPIDLRAVGRIAVVGAGKAGVGMARGFCIVLDEPLASEKRLAGWLNVPADCVPPPGDDPVLKRIVFHAARPAGRNEPTEAGVEGTRQILRLVESLGPRDLCFCLLSGGGSALLPLPVEGISLADKLAVTRFLSGAGADITELNAVRKQLSGIKGGGLARACRAGRLVSLIISDVIGDPLDVIASGPTTPNRSTVDDAIEVLARFDAKRQNVPSGVWKHLERGGSGARSTDSTSHADSTNVTNLIIGNNATAVDCAGMEAERLGYSHAMFAGQKGEGAVEPTGRHLARMGIRMRDEAGPDCLISGGEGTVQLLSETERGRGGRNQQLALAAACELLEEQARGVLILSGGTDGEDGPTDAAGAWIDDEAVARIRTEGLDAEGHLSRNDAYPFFERLGTLLKTGPTHTNVCDLRVVLVDREELKANRSD